MSHIRAEGSNTVGHGKSGGIQIRIVPKVGRIAVVRMDPVDMVSRLNLDDIALAQAQALQTKKYLVRLDFPEDMPHPDRDWCRYWVDPIATTLRAVSIEDGLAETMVHPIYPNTKYANKEPLRSSPVLPFPNCYFWFRSSMSLRVRVKRGEDWYDNDNSIEIPIPEIVKLDWFNDVVHMSALRKLKSDRTGAEHMLSIGPSLPPPLRTYTPSLDVSRGENESVPQATDLSRSHTATGDVENGLRSPRSSSHLPTTSSLPPHAHESSSLLQDCLNFNLLGWEEDPTFKFIPLVDLWFDLEEHLSSESIPSPVDLWMEQEKIGIIIEDGLRRRAAEQASTLVARFSIPRAAPRISPPSFAPPREKRLRTASMEQPSGRSQSQQPQYLARTSRDVHRSSQVFDFDIETTSVVSMKTCSDARMTMSPQRSWASLLRDPSGSQKRQTAARPAVWPLKSELAQKALQELAPLRRSDSRESRSQPGDTGRTREPEPQPRSSRQGEASRGRASGRGGRGRNIFSRRRGRGAPLA